MTPSELKYQVETRRTKTFFFTYKTMRFFGDTMRNYGVCDAGDYWELFRRKPVKHGLHSSTFFNKKTFEQIHYHV